MTVVVTKLAIAENKIPYTQQQTNVVNIKLFDLVNRTSVLEFFFTYKDWCLYFQPICLIELH